MPSDLCSHVNLAPNRRHCQNRSRSALPSRTRSESGRSRLATRSSRGSVLCYALAARNFVLHLRQTGYLATGEPLGMHALQRTGETYQRHPIDTTPFQG